MKKIWILLSLLVLEAATSSAAVLCVGPSATGDQSGRDWSNMKAWSSTPVRGDTWYLADGAYTGKTFNVSGTALTTIKKATAGDHVTNTGWAATVINGQATFSSAIYFETNNWVFDGQSGGGPGNWLGDKAGDPFGFRVVETGASNPVIGFGLNTFSSDSTNNANVRNIVLKHVDMRGMANANTGGGSRGNAGLGFWGGGDTTISYCRIDGTGASPVFAYNPWGVHGLIVEYSFLGKFNYGSAVHGEIISADNSADVTFRYNLITYSKSTGGMMMAGNGLYVYGNVFYQLPGDVWDINNGLVGTWTVSTLTNCKIMNNDFINIANQANHSILGVLFTNPTTGNEARNNLFYNVAAPISYSLIPTHSHNHYLNSGGTHGEATGTENTLDFVNYPGFDFKLQTNSTAGMPLTNISGGTAFTSTTFDRDMLGNLRTTWTRGANEYTGTSSTNPGAICVGPSATGSGDGSNWNNRADWDLITFTRGKTYYLVSGTYTSRSISTPMSGTAVITIKKASDVDPGSSVGWVNNSTSNGLGQAVLQGSFGIIDTGYITFDGGYEYGIKATYPIDLSATVTRSVGINVGGSGNFDRPNIIFKYFEAAGPAGAAPYPYHQHATVGLFAAIWTGANNTPVNIPGFTLSHCDFHGSCTLVQGSEFNNAVIEYSKFHDSAISDWQSVDDHPNVLYIQNSDDLIYRYNEMYNWDTEGLYPVYSTYRWKIYGNIWRDPSSGGNPRAIQPQASSGNTTQPGGLEIYNNTFVNLRFASLMELQILTEGATVYNNLFYNSPAPLLTGTKIRAANNLINPTTNPMMSSTDLHLKSGSAAIDTGRALSIDGFINKDRDGALRGQGNGWDIGAYEFNGTPPAPQTPSPHPADEDLPTPGDYFMTLDEVTAYSACWRMVPNQSASCPTPLNVDYAVRAGTLYKTTQNGVYHYDANVQSTQDCPACWVSGP